ncbi:hypothetical protein TNCV_2824481 [Trichonephila clavipes]|nr:hypothetical protein TNCV_2824481 [Trichonephila clavipes]
MKKREIGMARKRAENREGSLGFPGFVKPVFTKDRDKGGHQVFALAPRKEPEDEGVGRQIFHQTFVTL